jgi:hypothetical protein
MRKIQQLNIFIQVFIVLVFICSASIVVQSITDKNSAIIEYSRPDQPNKSSDMLWEAVARQFVNSSALP